MMERFEAPAPEEEMEVKEEECSRCPAETCISCRCSDGVCLLEEGELGFSGFESRSIFVTDPADESLEERGPSLQGPASEEPKKPQTDPQVLDPTEVVIGLLTADVLQLVCNQCREEKCANMVWWCR